MKYIFENYVRLKVKLTVGEAERHDAVLKESDITN